MKINLEQLCYDVLEEKKKRKRNKRRKSNRSSKRYGWGYIGYGSPGMYDGVADVAGGGDGGI